MRPLNKERILAASILIAVLLVFFYIIPNYIEITGKFELIGLSPAFFPKIITIFIGLLICLFLILTFNKKWGRLLDSKDESWLSLSEEMKAALSFAVIVAYLLLLKFVGYFISTPPVIFGLFFLQGERKIIKSAVISLIVTFGVYFLFHNLLSVQFPEGKFF